MREMNLCSLYSRPAALHLIIGKSPNYLLGRSTAVAQRRISGGKLQFICVHIFIRKWFVKDVTCQANVSNSAYMFSRNQNKNIPGENINLHSSLFVSNTIYHNLTEGFAWNNDVCRLLQVMQLTCLAFLTIKPSIKLSIVNFINIIVSWRKSCKLNIHQNKMNSSNSKINKTNHKPGTKGHFMIKLP